MLLVDEPQSLVSYHLRQLRDGGLVSARRSSADRRDSYYAIDLTACQEALQTAGGALHPALRLAPGRRPVHAPAVRVAGSGCCSCAPGTARGPRWPRRCSSACQPGRSKPRAREPSETTASQRRPRPSETWNRHQREPHQESRRVRLPAVRHGDHAVRPCSRGLPRVPVPPRARALERSGPRARGSHHPRLVPGVRAHRGRARVADQLPAPSVRHPVTTRRSTNAER